MASGFSLQVPGNREGEPHKVEEDRGNHLRKACKAPLKGPLQRLVLSVKERGLPPRASSFSLNYRAPFGAEMSLVALDPMMPRSPMMPFHVMGSGGLKT